MNRSIILLSLYLSLAPIIGFSQVSSVTSGDWHTPGTWSCNCVPDFNLGIIRIEPLHSVTISTTINADQLIVSADAILTIANGGRLIIQDGAGDDLTQEASDPPNSIDDGQVIVQSGGILENRGKIPSLSASLIFENGSEYQHNQNGNFMPYSTWQSGSTCRITGWINTTSGSPMSDFRASLAQAFHHFIWDSPGQTAANVSLSGTLTNVKGNLIINNTSINNNRLSIGANNAIIDILGDLIVSNQGRVNLAIAGGNGTYTINVGGNCTFSSINDNMNHYSVGGSAGVTNLNIAGDLILNNGQLNLAPVGGTGNINITGNLLLTGGTIIKPGAGAGTVSFVGSTNHDLDKVSGTFAGGNLVVQAGSTLNFTGVPLFMAGNITVQNGATLNMPAAISTSGDLQFVSGSIINSNAGTVTLTGSTLIQIVNANGATLANVTIAKSIEDANINLTSALSITGLLSVISTGARTVINTNGNLTLLSTSDGTTGNASIGPLLNTASVAGNVTTQRFMSAEGRIYRYISSPVTNAPVSQLQDDFPVTGPFPQSSSCPGCSTNPSLFFYDASTALYSRYPILSNTELLVPGRGYAAFIRQGVVPIPGVGPTTFDLTGPINQGNIPLPVFHNVVPDSSWNLVGNPYPSSIDWDEPTGWTKTNIGGSIAVRDAGAGKFEYWNGSAGGLTNGIIAAGQGFWAWTTGSSPVLTIHEAAKTSSTGSFLRKEGNDVMTIRVSKGTLSDETYFQFLNDASLGFDSYDAPKLRNDEFDFSTRFANTSPLAINAVNNLPCGSELLLDLRFTKKSSGEFVIDPVGNYTLSLDVSGSEFERYSITFFDELTGTEVPVISGFNYGFDITGDPASFSSTRFKLKFEGIPATLDINVTGADTVCGESTANVLVEDSDPKFDYQLMFGDKIISAEKIGTGATLALDVLGSLLPAGNNELRVRVNGVCGIEYLEETWTINRYPEAAITIEKGEVLASNYELGNQWYYNNDLIPGATDKTFKPAESGLYGLVVTHETCSSRTDIKFSITSIEDLMEVNSVFPNPFIDEIHVISTKSIDYSTLSVINNLGQSVCDQSSISQDEEGVISIKLNNLPDGFYFIRLNGPDFVRIVKVIKDSKLRK